MLLRLCQFVVLYAKMLGNSRALHHEPLVCTPHAAEVGARNFGFCEESPFTTLS